MINASNALVITNIGEARHSKENHGDLMNYVQSKIVQSAASGASHVYIYDVALELKGVKNIKSMSKQRCRPMSLIVASSTATMLSGLR